MLKPFQIFGLLRIIANKVALVEDETKASSLRTSGLVGFTKSLDLASWNLPGPSRNYSGLSHSKSGLRHAC